MCPEDTVVVECTTSTNLGWQDSSGLITFVSYTIGSGSLVGVQQNFPNLRITLNSINSLTLVSTAVLFNVTQDTTIQCSGVGTSEQLRVTVLEGTTALCGLRLVCEIIY